MHRSLTTALLASLSVLVATACAQGPPPTTRPAPDTRPVVATLVVFVTIDQLRGDYITRFGSQFTGGLRRLAASGTHFTNAFQDHANTETAPGHAATLSGRYPVSTGIAANSAGVNDPRSPLIGFDDATLGASPVRFRGTTLLDWMRAKNSDTRFMSVSRKDRGAILPIGKAKGDVYWYATNGTFTQSTYYARELPAWVRAFNAQQRAAKYAGWTWTPLLPDSAYSEPDSVIEESGGIEVAFPHRVPTDIADALPALAGFPVMDELTLRFALDGVRNLQLGAEPTRTDLLAISLSSTDAVGHRFGPDSKELHDQMLRVDRYLGAFVDSLFTMRDSTRVIFAVTGDHGMSPYPTRLSTVTPNPGAMYVDLNAPFGEMLARLGALGVDTLQVAMSDGALVIGDTASFVKANLSPDSVARALAVKLRAVRGVHRVDMLADLARADTTADYIALRWLRMFAPGGTVRFVTTLNQFNYMKGITNATHGSPWNDDASVPIMFWGTPFLLGTFSQRAHVVDMAPTIAAVLGIQPLERIDGVVLKSALRQ
jgi:predicted AlkP superfamily pyrophosphatase or phosphodiesterase